jgi:hypothetical protein
MTSTVYLLRDPRDDTPRYVGITKHSLKKRLSRHISVENRETDHRSNWIRQLISLGLSPVIELLEVVEDSQRIDSEQAWILGFRQIGANLVNSTDGGEGIINPSQETRIKLRNKRLGRHCSEGTKMKLRLARSSQVFTPEMWERHSLSHAKLRGVKRPLSVGIKISSAKMGHTVSEESRNKMRLAKLGKKATEETKQKMRATWIARRQGTTEVVNG